ncbi:MAG: esterase/lipase family protein [Candidatus Binatia bacterium]
MAHRGKVKNLVIVVPGMLGSRLAWHGNALWGDGSPTFLEWARRRGGEFGHLTLGPDEATADDLGDGISADAMLDAPLVAGRFLKHAGYAGLTTFLTRQVGLRVDENLRFFPYDWRRDLRVAARRLARDASRWLAEWRKRSGNPSARIVLLGHAMGGLVGRWYVDVEGGWRDVAGFVAIGTPFHGSLRALDLLYFGLDFASYGLSMPDVTPVARTLTSLYQVLPHYPTIEVFTGEKRTPFELRIPSFEHTKLERARQFHRDLADHHARNRAQEGYERMRTTYLVGVGQPTPDQARLLANGTLAIESDAAAMPYDGDGAVTRASAEAEGAGAFEGHSIYVPQTGGLLVSDPVVWSHLAHLLAEPTPTAPTNVPLTRFTVRQLQGGRLRVEADSLAVSVARPFYKAGQIVEIRALARSAFGVPLAARGLRLAARVEQVSRLGTKVRPLAVRLSPVRGAPGWYAGKLRAPPPGIYRVGVTASERSLAPFRPGDLFEVAAGH